MPKNASHYIAALLVFAFALSAGAGEPPAEALLAELPFLESGAAINRIFVNLAPEGRRELRMMLDTGATHNVITPLYARSLGVSIRRNTSSPYRRSTALGRDLQFWIDASLSDTGSKTGWEYGLLGGEFLKAYVVELDFPGRMVRFWDPKRFELPEVVTAPDEAIVKMELVGNRPFVVRPVREGSKKKMRLLLDTGAPFPLLLSGSVAKKMGIDVAALPHLSQISGTRGSTEARIYEDPAFQMGSLALGPVSTLVAPRGFYNQGGSDDSLIGFDILQQFVVRIDYKRQRLWLKHARPGPVTFGGADAAMMRKTGAYMIVSADGSHSVMGVLPDTPASRIGLRSEDVIRGRAADGKPFGSEQITRALLEGGELRILRTVDEVMVELALPELVVDLDRN